MAIGLMISLLGIFWSPRLVVHHCLGPSLETEDAKIFEGFSKAPLVRSQCTILCAFLFPGLNLGEKGRILDYLFST